MAAIARAPRPYCCTMPGRAATSSGRLSHFPVLGFERIILSRHEESQRFDCRFDVEPSRSGRIGLSRPGCEEIR